MFKRKSKSGKPAKPKKEKPSRKKREKKAKTKKASPPALPTKKQPSDIYTVMLVISFAAVLIACVLLWLELRSYGTYPWWKAA